MFRPHQENGADASLRCAAVPSDPTGKSTLVLSKDSASRASSRALHRSHASPSNTRAGHQPVGGELPGRSLRSGAGGPMSGRRSASADLCTASAQAARALLARTPTPPRGPPMPSLNPDHLQRPAPSHHPPQHHRSVHVRGGTRAGRVRHDVSTFPPRLANSPQVTRPPRENHSVPPRTRGLRMRR